MCAALIDNCAHDARATLWAGFTIALVDTEEILIITTAVNPIDACTVVK